MVDSDPLYHPVPNNTTDSTTNQYDSSDYSGLQVREDEQHPDYSGLQVREDDKNMAKGVGSASDSRSWQPGMADGSQHGDFQVRDRGENASDVLELMPKSPTQTRSWSRTNHAPPQGNSRKARLLDWLGGGKGVIITGVLVLVVLVIAIVGALVGSKKGRVRGKTGAGKIGWRVAGAHATPYVSILSNKSRLPSPPRLYPPRLLLRRHGPRPTR
jgi:hypothetical protein